MVAASALSSVVFPVPVPPEIRMFLRRLHGRHQRVRQRRRSASRLPRARPSAYRCVNFRTVSVGPSTEHGGNIAATREPSSRRASSAGCTSEISSPHARAMFLIATVRFRTSKRPVRHQLRCAPSRSTNTRRPPPLTITSVTVGSRSRSSIGRRNGRIRSRLLIARLAPGDRSSWSARPGSAASGSRTAAGAG